MRHAELKTWKRINILRKREKKMIKKLALLIMLVTFISTPAFAGNMPEFDAVGDDSDNFFNDFIQELVVENNEVWDGKVNEFSDFTTIYDANGEPLEFFEALASRLAPSPCFNPSKLIDGYFDRKTAARTAGSYEWQIVLQMQPQTDLDLMIRDCVLEENRSDIWFNAQQTGRYRLSNNKLKFANGANPTITVEAIPGHLQFPGTQSFLMDARRMPGLGLVTLDDKRYTSKALWQEGLVMKLPEQGKYNKDGDPVFVLREGDQLNVKIAVPSNNPVDIYYGPDCSSSIRWYYWYRVS